LTPFGILVIGTGLLSLIFGDSETSDFWGDCFYSWWLDVRAKYRNISRLVIYMDNGPNNSGNRTQFLKRMIDFADWSGLELHLIYYPPYHSKYNPIERCWSSLQQKWGGTLLTCWDVVWDCATRMLWKSRHPDVYRLRGKYAKGVIVPKTEMQEIEKRLKRSASLPKYDIIITPKPPRGR